MLQQFSKLGLRDNPFSKRSSEQELQFLDKIFFEPNYYLTLQDNLKSGDTRFIYGQRGYGKSSIINKLYNDIHIDSDYLVIKLDRFEGISNRNNKIEFLILILRKIITYLGLCIQTNPKLVKNLNGYDKEIFVYFLELFFHSYSAQEYSDIHNKFSNHKTNNFFKKIYNFFIPLFNVVTNAGVNVTSTLISQSIGANGSQNELIHREYFKDLEISDLKRDINLLSKSTAEEIKNIFDSLFIIINKIGFKRTIILIDKIDENQQLGPDVVNVANFTKDLLGDTEFLMNENLAIGFSLWTELRSELNGNVRFDKFGFVDVRWRDEDMIPLIDKRLKHFSQNIHLPITFRHLFKEDYERVEILKLSNKSPRNLIILMGEILSEYINRDSQTNYFDYQSIKSGSINFCKHYDYDSFFPSKVGKNKEIKSMINRLLKMKLIRFDESQMNNFFRQNISQTNGQIKIMINYNLIKEEEILGDSGQKIYEIIDPKIIYLIKNTIENID